jgi:hypothetical protein
LNLYEKFLIKEGKGREGKGREGKFFCFKFDPVLDELPTQQVRIVDLGK